jgi:hypothetical protein
VTETVVTLLRRYLDKGHPKVEAVTWQWVPGDRSSSDRASTVGNVDPGMAAKARPLPAESDPGLVPNRWVWIGANDPAAKLPRPGVSTPGERSMPDGTSVPTVELHHHDDGAYWDYYRLPLRPGVEIVDEDRWATAAEEARVAAVALAEERDKKSKRDRADRDKKRGTVRAKLQKLGLDDDEIDALIR